MTVSGRDIYFDYKESHTGRDTICETQGREYIRVLVGSGHPR